LAADVGAGKCISCKVGRLEVLVCNANGSFYAVENRCSHLGKPLAGGRLIGTELTCPFHSASFDIRDGRNICFPASRPIRSFRTRLKNGFIEVAAPELGSPGPRRNPVQ
jgi:3-phenylpropionate/trans-cinnamate dioxygenase ferredoxin component